MHSHVRSIFIIEIAIEADNAANALLSPLPPSARLHISSRERDESVGEEVKIGFPLMIQQSARGWKGPSKTRQKTVG
jgi:hypothetical protein